MSFADHFSGHAEDYAAFRPDYPDALFDYLAGLAPSRRRAWDCATGNGQAAIRLAGRFEEVVATDASGAQIANARPAARVAYRVAPAHASGLEDASVDLVTVAQSLHWLELPPFWSEVRRVLVPGGPVAFWCYDLASVTSDVDRVIGRLYHEIVGPYWPAERRLVETGYRTVAVPFEEIETPPFAMEKTWSLPELAAYLATWSAAKRFEKATGRDPIREILPDLAAAWDADPDHSRRVSWELSLRIGRKAPR